MLSVSLLAVACATNNDACGAPDTLANATVTESATEATKTGEVTAGRCLEELELFGAAGSRQRRAHFEPSSQQSLLRLAGRKEGHRIP